MHRLENLIGHIKPAPYTQDFPACGAALAEARVLHGAAHNQSEAAAACAVCVTDYFCTCLQHLEEKAQLFS